MLGISEDNIKLEGVNCKSSAIINKPKVSEIRERRIYIKRQNKYKYLDKRNSDPKYRRRWSSNPSSPHILDNLSHSETDTDPLSKTLQFLLLTATAHKQHHTIHNREGGRSASSALSSSSSSSLASSAINIRRDKEEVSRVCFHSGESEKLRSLLEGLGEEEDTSLNTINTQNSNITTLSLADKVKESRTIKPKTAFLLSSNTSTLTPGRLLLVDELANSPQDPQIRICDHDTPILQQTKELEIDAFETSLAAGISKRLTNLNNTYKYNLSNQYANNLVTDPF